MSQPDSPALPPGPSPLARRDGEPVFDEPWQAQVLALAFTLMERGVFSNARWSEALGEALKAADRDGEPDEPATYYRCAQRALESLLAGDGRISGDALGRRIAAWRQAYLNTPHGEPVELTAADEAPRSGE